MILDDRTNRESDRSLVAGDRLLSPPPVTRRRRLIQCIPDLFTHGVAFSIELSKPLRWKASDRTQQLAVWRPLQLAPLSTTKQR